MRMKVLIGAIALLAAAPAMAQSNSNATSGSASQAGVSIYSPGAKQHRMAPSAIAPGLAAAGIEACLGSNSAAVSGGGWGFSLGGTKVDEGCEARLDARTLHAFGHSRAAMTRLCLRPLVREAMAMAGTPCPQDLGVYEQARQVEAIRRNEGARVRSAVAVSHHPAFR